MPSPEETTADQNPPEVVDCAVQVIPESELVWMDPLKSAATSFTPSLEDATEDH